jgi:hypothetical protein
LGVDLTLLPVSYETNEGDLICLHAFQLELSRVKTPFMEMTRQWHHGKIFWPIESASDDVIPWCAAPYIGGSLQNSRFGWATNEQPFVIASEVQKAFAALADVLAEVNDFERAAIAYISALEPSTKVFVISQ